MFPFVSFVLQQLNELRHLVRSNDAILGRHVALEN